MIASVISPIRLKLIPTAVMITERQARRAQTGHRVTMTKTELIASALANAIEWPKAPSARTKPPLGCNSCQVRQAPFGMTIPTNGLKLVANSMMPSTAAAVAATAMQEYSQPASTRASTTRPQT